MDKLNAMKRMLSFIQVLKDHTDEEHPKTRLEIEKLLLEQGIEINRKTFYSYIEELRLANMDIVSIKKDKFYYYVKDRHFNFAESKLLIDAVQSSRFISKDKSEELILKIGQLMSLYQASDLKRKLYMGERTKTFNKNVYRNVDIIQEAIGKNRQISFRYFDYYLDSNHQHRKQFRKQGKQYVVSPYSLVWAEDNYYVVSFYDQHQGLTNFRVDRLDSIVMIQKSRASLREVTGQDDFSIARYSQNIFSMFYGKTQRCTICFDMDLLNTAIDRFGQVGEFKRIDEKSFSVSAEVQVSPTFFGWIFQFGDKIKICEPKSVVEQFKDYLHKVSHHLE